MAEAEFPMLEVGDWLDVLPAYQRSTISDLLGAGKTEEEVAELWLNRTGPDANAGFGVGTSIKNYFSNFHEEWDAFVCGDARYEKQRTETALVWKKHGKTAFVAAVAGYIGATIGLTAVALIPVVALFLGLVGKMSVGAYCKSRGKGPDVPTV